MAGLAAARMTRGALLAENSPELFAGLCLLRPAMELTGVGTPGWAGERNRWK